MEQRLIDANALLEKSFNTGYEYGEINVVGTTHIEEAPTVDAVAVVRCGECKHSEHYHEGMSLEISGYLCELIGKDVKPTDFCSYGERRTTP